MLLRPVRLEFGAVVGEQFADEMDADDVAVLLEFRVTDRRHILLSLQQLLQYLNFL